MTLTTILTKKYICRT